METAMLILRGLLVLASILSAFVALNYAAKDQFAPAAYYMAFAAMLAP